MQDFFATLFCTVAGALLGELLIMSFYIIILLA